ncbi:hypothetical protein CRENBAI_005483 [Crenichthys baileyi]|uniref:Uncharacterized protein n=1 Tax=Crenichthys baileyi TaxID=28760 RepID=A0AAV9S6S8_9TELE
MENPCGTPMTHPHPKALHDWKCDGVGGGRCPGMGRECLGGKCSPREPAPWLTPIDTPFADFQQSLETQAHPPGPENQQKTGTKTPSCPPGTAQTPIPSPDTQSPAQRSHE